MTLSWPSKNHKMEKYHEDTLAKGNGMNEV